MKFSVVVLFLLTFFSKPNTIKSSPLQEKIPYPACALDVLFVLDGSSSVDKDFEKMRNFIIELSSLLNVGPYAHRVALLEYSGPTRKWPQFPFGFAKTTDEFVDAIKRLPYIKGVTRTAAALKIAKSMLDERRKDVGTIVLVVTDGYSQDDVRADAEEIRLMQNVLVFSVEIPEYYNIDELILIAGNVSRVIVKPDIETKAKNLLAPYLNCQNLIGAAFAVVSTSSTTTTTTTTIPTTTTPFVSGCELDLILVVDFSSSVFNSYKAYLEIAEQLVSPLRLGSYYTRFSFIHYASKWRTEALCHLNDFMTKEKAIEEIKKSYYTGGTTNTAAGLILALEEFKPEKGGRPGLAKQVAVVFSDGFSQHDPTKPAQDLRNQGVQLFVIANEIKNEAPNMDELQIIAGDGKPVYNQNEIPKVIEELRKLSNEHCRELPSELSGSSKRV